MDDFMSGSWIAYLGPLFAFSRASDRSVDTAPLTMGITEPRRVVEVDLAKPAAEQNCLHVSTARDRGVYMEAYLDAHRTDGTQTVCSDSLIKHGILLTM